MGKIFRGGWLPVAVSMLFITSACGAEPLGSGVRPGTASSTPAASAVSDGAESDRQPGAAPESESATLRDGPAAAVRVGAAVWADDGFRALDGKRVGLITNAAATVDGRVSVFDAMVAAEVDVVAVFAPEHGFGADLAAGAEVPDLVDADSDIAVFSIYGSSRAPSPDALAGVDVLVFDLQDVGVRAYTYLASMALSMEAAATADVAFVVLDRPNPIGGERIEGWIRGSNFESFVSQLPVPAVHGLTAGETALAIQGEGWLSTEGLDLTVVEVDGWVRSEPWRGTDLPWLAPSPSLPVVDSVAVYPGIVLLEATTVSVGRGTDQPFNLVGAPWVDAEALATTMNAYELPGVGFEATSFTPMATPSVPAPPYDGRPIPGVRVLVLDPGEIEPFGLGVHLLAELGAQASQAGEGPLIDQPAGFDLLAGTDELRRSVVAGRPPGEIVDSWAGDVDAFRRLREPYLLYD